MRKIKKRRSRRDRKEEFFDAYACMFWMHFHPSMMEYEKMPDDEVCQELQRLTCSECEDYVHGVCDGQGLVGYEQISECMINKVLIDQN